MSDTSEKILKSVDEFLQAEWGKAYLSRFTNQWAAAQTRAGYQLIELNKPWDARKVGEVFQFFWEELPDNRSIHGQAFNFVCDVAEWYCFGDEEEDE